MKGDWKMNQVLMGMELKEKWLLRITDNCEKG